jgi:xylulokinase
MLELAGIDADLPAPIAASGTALGPVLPEVLAEIGLAGSPLVAVGGHDHTVGAFAAGLAEPGTMVNSIGTAEALLLSTPQPLRDPETIRRGYVQGAIATDSGTAYLGGSLFSSGGAIDWLRSIVGDVGPAALIAEASAVPVGSRGVVFLPYLANGPPPHPDENARGAFFGLTPSVKRAELYRAVLEGLAIQSRMMLDGMVSLPGVDTPRRIRLIGGVSRNDLFLRIKANAFGRPIHVVEEPEATALGTALLGGVGAGLYADLDAAVAGLDQREDVVEPDASVERYDRLRTMVFEGVQDMVRPINRGLAEFNKSVGTAGAGSDPAAGEHASMQRDRQ